MYQACLVAAFTQILLQYHPSPLPMLGKAVLCPYVLADDKIPCVQVEITEVSLAAVAAPIGPGYDETLARLPFSPSSLELQEPAVMNLQSKNGTGLILRWAVGGDQAERKGPHQPQIQQASNLFF